MTRKITMIAALGLVVVLAALWSRQRATRISAGVHAFELSDGKQVHGVLMTLRAGSYILQTGEQCLLLGLDDIRRIDGKVPAGAALGADRKVLFAQESFEDISDSGYVEVRSTWRWRNDGAQVLDQVDWGLNAHEIPQLQHYRVIDSYGNELGLRIEDDATIHGKRVFVALRRPVLPGEEGRLTVVYREPGRLEREDGEWIYRHVGDYPDDRLVTRSVCLPAGAAVVAVRPQALYTVTTAGRELVVWRRFFAAGEQLPWEIRYRLSLASR